MVQTVEEELGSKYRLGKLPGRQYYNLLYYCQWRYVSRDIKFENLTDRMTAISAAVDLYLTIYPAVVLYGLQLNIKKKVAFSAALCLGAM